MDSSTTENFEESPRIILLKAMNRFASTSCKKEEQKEIITRLGREYGAMPEENDELDEEIALLQEILMQQEEIYHNDIEDYQKQIENTADIIQTYEDKEKEISEKIKLENEKEIRLKVTEQEYENEIENLCVEKYKIKDQQEVENQSIAQALLECRNLLSEEEKKFAELHKAYELVKTKRDNYEAQKMQLECQISHAGKLFEQKEKGYQSLDELSKKEFERADRELKSVRQTHQIECTKLKGFSKKLDSQIESLEQMIQQQLKENSELTAIYDDCLNKIGTNKPMEM